MNPTPIDIFFESVTQQLGGAPTVVVGGIDVIETLRDRASDGVTFYEIEIPSRFTLDGKIIPFVSDRGEILEQWLGAPCEKVWALAPGKEVMVLVLRPTE